MSEAVVSIVSGLVIGAAATCGYRAGVRACSIRLLGVTAPWCGFALAVWAATSWHWFWPLGLITPLLTAVAVFCMVRLLVKRRPRKSETPPPSRSERGAGALLGAAVGALLSTSLWLGLMVCASLSASPAPDRQAEADVTPKNWLRPLVETVNRGFVRHIPFLGPIGDELEALVLVMNADRTAQQRVAAARGWQELAEIPEIAAALTDTDVDQHLIGVRDGNLLALYRLQRHPKILALVDCERVHEAIDGLRPTQLARELK